MPGSATEPGAAALFARGRNRAFVKIQDGCRHKCTFCIVTVARGAERSRATGDIVGEINRLHSRQVREAVLTGVHIGAYGHDLGTDLPSLVNTILAETDIPRLRLGSLEPWNIDEDFFALFDNPRFMPHLHLPLQSGSDTVLRRMGRRCRTGEYMSLARTAAEIVPDLNLTTDVIAGFPGETDDRMAADPGFLPCGRVFPHPYISLFGAQRHPGCGAAGTNNCSSEEKSMPAAAWRGAADETCLYAAPRGSFLPGTGGKRCGRHRMNGRRTTVIHRITCASRSPFQEASPRQTA